MANTTNFGWETPDDTDLVKDGAAAMRTLGNAIDASFVDLKGGTTGQVLSKNSNTDMDFTWVAQDDSNAIQNAIVDAKGDLISATAADTPARLAVGTNGQVLTADSSTATGLKWATVSAGGMTQLATGTLSGASVTISSISGSYRSLRLILSNAYPANDAEGFSLRFNSSSTDYYVINYNTANVSSGGTFSQTEVNFCGNVDNAVTGGLSVIDIDEYSGATWKTANFVSYYPNSTTTTNTNFYKLFAVWNKTNVITSLQLFPTAGNFGGGTYTLYGVS